MEAAPQHRQVLIHEWSAAMRSLRPLRIPTLALALAAAALVSAARADHTPAPATVTLPGSFQSELGCAGDWDPACAVTNLTYDPGTDTWVGNFTIPAGSWEYKVAINGTWDENYGAGGVQNGPNIPLVLGSEQNVTFIYDHTTHVVTQSVAPIVVAPGSFQSEVGCPSDWDPACLTTQLLDADLDGVFVYQTSLIPPGDYEFKIALGLSWDINYGEGGVPGGANIPFTVPAGGAFVTISWNSTTLVPSVVVDTGTPAQSASWGRVKAMYR
jgi:hypothetical protein